MTEFRNFHCTPWLLALGFAAWMGACDREPEPDAGLAAATDAPGQSRTDRHRTRMAAITIRFASGQIEPGTASLGVDRLQIAAVFGDIDQRDRAFLGDLVGQSLQAPAVPGLDSCVRQPSLLHQFGSRPGTPPHAWAQLLDVGNVVLRGGKAELALRVQMVPSLFDATRGVRYDADQDMGRTWLAAGTLHVHATGGDGVAAFDAQVPVPRPVRLTHVGSAPVRGSRVHMPEDGQDLLLRWGSVDGAADLEVQLGAEQPGGLGWLRCRLHDDGSFAVPAALLAQLPPRSPERPWVVMLVRSRQALVPGFEGKPLRLELTDRAYIE